MQIPFLRPNLVSLPAVEARLQSIDATRRYSNFGPLVSEFERRVVSELIGATGGAVTVCNATIGLMLAIAAVRRTGARFAVMPSFTFAATPLAAQWCGLTPYFVDVDPETWCPDSSRIADAVQRLGPDLAAVVTYATFGAPMALNPYRELVDAGVPVVIDAAPCLGARSGACAFAAGFPGPVVYSLHATKAFAIGEGGLIYSGDVGLVERIRRMSNFGFGPDRASLELGLNGKMPEIAGAFALATLDAFAQKMALREALYGVYVDELAGGGLLAEGWQLQRFDGHTPHQFMPVACAPRLTNSSVAAAMHGCDIEVRTYFSPPCHQQPQFATCPNNGLPVTDDLARRCLSLPLWEEMTPATVQRVVAALKSVAG